MESFFHSAFWHLFCQSVADSNFSLLCKVCMIGMTYIYDSNWFKCMPVEDMYVHMCIRMLSKIKTHDSESRGQEEAQQRDH